MPAKPSLSRKVTYRLPIRLLDRLNALRDGDLVASERDAVVMALLAGLDSPECAAQAEKAKVRS